MTIGEVLHKLFQMFDEGVIAHGCLIIFESLVYRCLLTLDSRFRFTMTLTSDLFALSLCLEISCSIPDLDIGCSVGKEVSRAYVEPDCGSASHSLIS